MNRRKLIKSLGALTGAAVLTGLYTWQIEPFWLEIVYQKMKVKNLPIELKGKTVMQISDIHVGDRFDYQFLIDSFQQVAQLNPDYVVYTGDYVSWKNSKQLSQLREVMQHTVKGRLGTTGILGNHDYGHGWSQNHVADDISQILTDSGITVLRNEQQSFEGLNIIGLDDYWATNFQPSSVMSKVDASQYDLGDGRHMYINRALGNLYQVRFNARPEITVFEFV